MVLNSARRISHLGRKLIWAGLQRQQFPNPGNMELIKRKPMLKFTALIAGSHQVNTS